MKFKIEDQGYHDIEIKLADGGVIEKTRVDIFDLYNRMVIAGSECGDDNERNAARCECLKELGYGGVSTEACVKLVDQLYAYVQLSKKNGPSTAPQEIQSYMAFPSGSTALDNGHPD